MSDWKPGDKAVYIGHPGNNPPSLRIGQVVTITADLGIGSCKNHGLVQGVDIDFDPVEDKDYYGYCHHCFRRPINFTQLLNIEAKHKEPA